MSLGHLFSGIVIVLSCGTTTGAGAASAARTAPLVPPDGGRWRIGFHRQGPDGWVAALTEYDGSVVAAGSFRFIGSHHTEGVARWTGAEWEPLGDGLVGSVECLLVHDGVLFAGGRIIVPDGQQTRAPIAAWDGNLWSYLTGAIPTPVTDMTIHHGQLHIATAHNRTGPGSTIFRWSGSVWEPLGDDLSEYSSDYGIAALESFGDSLFASWNENSSGETLGLWDPRPAFLDTAGWQPMSTEVEPGCGLCSVECFDVMTVYRGKLMGALYYTEYLGNFKFLRGGVVAEWTGSFWRKIGGVLPEQPRALTVHNDKLYTLVWRHGIHVWDGTYWNRIAGGPEDYAVLGTTSHGLAVGASQVRMPDQTHRATISLWNDGSWTDLTQGDPGLGLARAPTAIATTDSSVVAFGDLVGNSQVEARMLRPGAWEATPDPPSPFTLDGNMASLYQGDMVATGLRNRTDGALLRLRADQWEPIGTFNHTVYALSEYGGALVAGGDFTYDAGTVTRMRRIAEYRDGEWRPMGGGVNSIVGDLYTDGTDLIAGGTFTTAGASGTTALHVARWNGQDWEGIGDGTRLNVSAVALYNGHPVAAEVVTIGSDWDHPNGRVSWFVDGQWKRLAEFNGFVYDLAVFQGRLVVGGAFTRVGNRPMPGLVWFDGERWNPVAGGIDGTVRKLAVRGNQLWAGGNFRSAGDVASRCIALLEVPEDPVIPIDPVVPLEHPWPNPSALATHIPLSLDAERHVRVTIHDIQGREVARIADGILPAGSHDAVWNGATAVSSQPLPSGVYFSRVVIDGVVSTQAFLRIR